MNKTITNRLIGFSSAGLLFLTALWMAFHRPGLHYPNLVMDAPEQISISFLLNGQQNPTDCQATIANLASAMLASCPNCRIKQLQCFSELNTEQQRQLSAAPLRIPSTRMSNGVALYYAQEPAIALAACQESERQSALNANSAAHLKCFPSETLRRFAPESKLFDIGQFTAWQTGGAFLLLCSAAFLLFTALRPGPGGTFSITQRALLQVANFSRRQKQIIIAASDAVLISLALWLAFTLRFEHAALPQGETLWLHLIAPTLAIPLFIRLGLYRAITRYLGMQAVATLSKAVVLYIALFALAVFLLDLNMPRSVLIAHGILTLMFIGATRFVARGLFKKLQLRGQATTKGGRNALIYGAGSAGVQLASALEFSRELRPVAFMDDDPSLHNQVINGLKVYSPDALQSLLSRYPISEVLLAMPSTQRSRRNAIMNLLEPLKLNVRTLPGMDELAQGTVKVEDLREVGIEDLLGRDPVPADSSLLQKNITGKTVLVTGAGGSIGSELCRQILRLQPGRLVLFERNEFALYNIERELLDSFESNTSEHRPELIPILGSVTDQARIERVLTRFDVETVFHAAAYKHVPMVEKNPIEGMVNNILGTWCAANAALTSKVETFVLISTDKAVRPTNTMGTTKRFAEMILQALAANHPDQTHFTMVRFGNVLGSSGSVIPLFREQIRRGGPITVTDPRIIRYFMTISEAAQLVIQAGAMGKDGDVFVLDMGEPVKILDLATRMVHLSGLSIRDENSPDGDIEIVFSGLRPGEKLYEELLIGDGAESTTHPRIMRANEESISLQAIRDFINRFEDICKRGATDELREVLMQSVKGFAPQCSNEDLLLIEKSVIRSSE